jgi:hypothetical protein
MKKMPTKISEQVYEILCKFADVDSNYYEKETFVYHFGVLSDKDSKYILTCKDDRRRVFHCTQNGNMWVEGASTGRANSILKKFSEELKSTRS